MTKEGLEFKWEEIEFSRAAELMSVSGEYKYYMLQIPVKEQLPELADDISCPAAIDPAKLRAINFWLSGAGNVTVLHYDHSKITSWRRFTGARNSRFSRLINPNTCTPCPLTPNIPTSLRSILRVPICRHFRYLGEQRPCTSALMQEMCSTFLLLVAWRKVVHYEHLTKFLVEHIPVAVLRADYAGAASELRGVKAEKNQCSPWGRMG